MKGNTARVVLPSLSGYIAKLCFLMEKGDADRQRDEAGSWWFDSCLRRLREVRERLDGPIAKST